MTYRIGQVLNGTITGIQHYGVFVSLDETTQGLIHISECAHGYVSNLESLFHIGQNIEVLVLDIDEYSKKISLSVRALQKDPNIGTKWCKKHYWTNRYVDSGFQPISTNMPSWLRQAEKDFGVPDVE
ncbi:CvfD/Ygs/GSP13 family RNA-binding post-transcriptional regulator [Agrilactobacillus fermenti]|uniref:CvfD/Ygs/GSP13 family RNA-binding post-transcriptional regulator n=1 Tax=Agrilactobacillus fermenti TaxID=2586909 RepID=UPI001E6065E4|nr:CvfD/Ygs/GSP13 family RNA-binding post-transcriptional regulator [Agrilactobacillus fermenti]MCD2257246.1 S1 RNA-binding domain-containing protein [Agrilactobacillus fermenti]